MEQMSQRIPEATSSQTFLLAVRSGWRILGLMLIGMALFRWGVLTAERSRRFYLTLVAVSSAIGFPLVIYGLILNNRDGWTMEYSLFQGQLLNYWGSVFVSAGYIGTVMLVCKSLDRTMILGALSAVGRMAFTNYILQTVICTTLFYGHGLGLFGQIARTGQILIVFAVWGLQLVLSPLWLRRFRYGPMEWLWRSLAYKRMQLMRY